MKRGIQKFLGIKKSKNDEETRLLQADGAITEGISDISVNVVIDRKNETSAITELKKKKDRIKLKITDHTKTYWPRSEITIEEKPFKSDENFVVYKIIFEIGALNAQAVIDGVKVQIDHEKLEGWIMEDHEDQKYQMKLPTENPDLYPSTHFINVPYDLHTGGYAIAQQETKHKFTEGQFIWLANSLFDLDQLQAKKIIASYYVAHDEERLKSINFGNWYNVLLFETKSYAYKEFSISTAYAGKGFLPAVKLNGDSEDDVFDKIRRYFGEQVSLYFRFAMHLSKWTGVLGLLGALFQAYILYTLDFASPLLAVFAIMVIVWANLFTETWKKNELECTYRWGTDEFESKEETRYEYLQSSKLDNEAVYGYTYEVDNRSLMFMQTFSVLVIAVIMLCVVCSTIMIYQFKSFLQVKFIEIGVPSQLSATCASMLNIIQINVFKFIYRFVAEGLNEHENHRTVTEHEDSMISKLTIFTFFNTYISFFYIAFVAGSMSVYTDVDDGSASNQCGYTGCMAMLAENLLIVLLISLTIDKFVEFILMPLMDFETIKRIACSKCCESVDTEAERDDYKLGEYDFNQRLSDYSTLFTYFGYIVLFSPALPLAPLLVAFSTAFELRGDLNKLKKDFRRTWARAQSIGAWQQCFEVITVAGVICNSAMIVFTMRIFSGYSFVIQMWIFIGMQWLMFALLALGASVISGPPYKVHIQRKRLEYYREVLTHLALPGNKRDADEDDDEH